EPGVALEPFPPTVEDGAVHPPGPQDALEFLEREPEGLVRGSQEARRHEPRRLLKDRLFREVEDPDDVVLGVFSQADPRAVDGDAPPPDHHLHGAATRRPEAFEETHRGALRLLLAGLKIAAVLPGSSAPQVPFDGGDELRRRLAPTRPGDVDFARTPHAVPLTERGDRSADFFSPRNLPRVAVKRLVGGSPQALDRSGMRPADVRHVAECEPHLRRHVAGRRATEAREFRRVAEPPLRKASDETEGNHPGQDALEDLPADQVRKKRPGRRSDPPNPLRTSHLLDSPPSLGDQSLHGPLDLLHPTAWVAEEECSEDRQQERRGLQDERQLQSLLRT